MQALTKNFSAGSKVRIQKEKEKGYALITEGETHVYRETRLVGSRLSTVVLRAGFAR